MKKIVFVTLILFGACITSCGTKESTSVEEETMDTLVVEVDSICPDSISVDTL